MRVSLITFPKQVVGELQKELTLSNREIKDLRSQVADFALSKAARAAASRRKDCTCANSTPSPSPSSSGSILDPAELRQGPALKDGKKLDGYITPLGTYFAAFYTPSVIAATFSRPKPCFLPDSTDRYPAGTVSITRNSQTGAMESPISDHAYISGLVSELYESIPPAFHSFMAKSVEFPKQVSRGSTFFISVSHVNVFPVRHCCSECSIQPAYSAALKCRPNLWSPSRAVCQSNSEGNKEGIQVDGCIHNCCTEYSST